MISFITASKFYYRNPTLHNAPLIQILQTSNRYIFLTFSKSTLTDRPLFSGRKQHLSRLKHDAFTWVESQHFTSRPAHNGHPCPSLTITSVPSASRTCLFVVCPLTQSSPRLAPEQSKACDSKLACRHSTHTQTLNPMIQAGTRLFPASVSSQLYILGLS